MVLELKLDCSKTGAGGNPCHLVAVVSFCALRRPLFLYRTIFITLCLSATIVLIFYLYHFKLESK